MSGAVGVVVLARLDSARVPGKALADIGGRPMLELVVARAAAIPGADVVIVATSDRALDDPIAEWATGAGHRVHRGSAEDVLGRCARAAEVFGLDALVRISGDSPFIDAEVGGRVLHRYAAGDVDLATNLAPRTFPPGVSVEVLSRSLLDRLDAGVDDAEDREHVTRWCYRNPDAVTIGNVAASPPWSTVHLAVDSLDDLARARWIAAELGAEVDRAPLATVAGLAVQWDAEHGIAH